MAVRDKIRVHVVGCGTDSDGVTHVVDQEVCGDTVCCVSIDRENDSVKGCIYGKFDDNVIAATFGVLIDQIGVQRAINGIARAMAFQDVIHELKRKDVQAHE